MNRSSTASPDAERQATRFDCLDAPLLSITQGGDQPERVDLPTLLARLARPSKPGEFLEFPALAAHQQHGWFAFLVQLAGLAVARGGGRADADAAGWRASLLELTSGARGPWCLLNESWEEPALLQPPVAGGDITSYKRIETSPEAIDLLVLAKSHDIKSERFAQAEPEHWLYALVDLQTMISFSGRGNYAIARMNGGFGSRPGFTAAADLDWGTRFRRDLGELLGVRDSLLKEVWGFDSDGAALLWLLPWRGEKSESLSVADLDPFALEIARRARLVEEGGSLVVRLSPTKGPRVDAKIFSGHLGDLWVPTRKKGDTTTALSVSENGLTYKLLHPILFGGDEYTRNVALELREGDGEAPKLIAQVLVGGQGKTGGYHERILPVPPHAIRRRRRSPGYWEALGKLAQERVARVDEARRKVLHPAICTLLQGAPEKLNFKDEGSQLYTRRLDAEVDAIFFERLWSDGPLSTDEQEIAWDTTLWSLCQRLFDDAVDAVPIPDARFYRSLASATRVLRGSARKNLKGAFRADDESLEAALESSPDLAPSGSTIEGAAV